MSDKRAKGILVAAVVWCVIIVVLAVAYRFFIHPYFKERTTQQTGSASQYQHTIRVAADSFTGYCILRSESMREQLKDKGIRFEVVDDSADYEGRMQALRDGDAEMAVFTVDSFLTSGARIGEFPASIVLVLDETKGADAMVAYKSAVPSIQDLDAADARIVATPNSPSEFLARVVLAHFSLPQLPKDWLIRADGADDAYRRLCSASKQEKRAYVLWQPYVSMAVEREDVHVLLDSSKMSGLIVDVLVARRSFLADHAELVQEVVESYLRAAYRYDQRPDDLVSLVLSDAQETGAEKLSKEQAGELAKGIQWKNTMENYAHFGLLPRSEEGGLGHLEDIIANISGILVKTGAMKSEPVAGKEHTLFYSQTLATMKERGFHPGKELDVLTGMGLGAQDLEQLRGTKAMPKLSEEQWGRLVPVGEMNIRPIVFGRGSARLNVQSERDLEELAKQLKSLPEYYLIIQGHARAEGDPEANAKLARERAEAAAGVLDSHGVGGNRMRVTVAQPSQRNGAAQAVSFVVSQVPY